MTPSRDISKNSEPNVGVRPVKSAERTIALLEYLSVHEGGRSLREVANDLSLPRASAHALLTTLSKTGWVETDTYSSRYKLGIRALRAGSSYLVGDQVVHAAAGVMDRLSRNLGETIHLARLDGHEIVYLATRPSTHALSFVAPPGRRLPAWATALGKSLLAQRPWETVDAILPRPLTALTPNTVTRRSALKAQLETVRELGYAKEKGESAEGLRCFAVAFGWSDPAPDALSCSVPSVRLTAELEQLIIGELLAAKESLTGPVARHAPSG